jgi:integrase
MSVWKDKKRYRFAVQRRGRVIKGSADTEEQAQELEAKALLDLHAKRIGRAPEYSLEEALLRYMDSPEFTGLKSGRHLESHMRAVLPYVKKRLLEDAPDVAERMTLEMRKAGLKPATINRRLQILQRVCNMAYKKWRWLDVPVSHRIAKLPERNARHVYLMPEEAERLIDACRNPYARDAITLAVYTGLRAGELFRLTTKDVRNDCIILPPVNKTDRPRTVPLPCPAAIEAASRLPLAITYRRTITFFWEARAMIGRDDLRFHDLRHTYGSWLAESGAQATDIRDLMGHRSPATTSRYLHLSSARLKLVASGVTKKKG